MPRPKRHRSANELRPRARDLFRQVPVTLDELRIWVNAKAPHMMNDWRFNWYVNNYNVPEKIQQAKINGDFWQML